MAIINGTISAPGESFDGSDVEIDIPTVRINELPPADLPFDPDDKFPLYDSSQNKTVWVGTNDMITYLTSGVGGGGSIPPPVGEGSIIGFTVTAPMITGGYRIDYAPLAGLTYSLERRGRGTLKADEFTIQSTGGFELADHLDEIMTGEVFFAKVYNYLAPPDPITSVGSLFNGMAVISSNTALSGTHLNKLLHISGGSSAVEITLWDLADVPDNLIVVIETTINNTKKTKIKTTASQNIYYLSSSNNELCLGVSEFLWLLKAADGYYVINASAGLHMVGETYFGYKAGLNDLIMQGQTVLRADEPRLWAWVQTLGSSLVSDITWFTSPPLSGEYPYKGCFSTGDGFTTFRLPDLRNQFVRGLRNIGSTDSERIANIPGGMQSEEVGKHTHPYDGIPPGDNKFSSLGGGSDFTANQVSLDTDENSGTETRPINVGLLPLIRS